MIAPSPLRTARRLTAAALAIGFLHHVDHVLRYDHSGWPFKPEVTGFTYSLSAYPLLLFALLSSKGSQWWRFGAVAAAAVATVVAHSLIETPLDQYARWAWNSAADGVGDGMSNLLAICSPGLGVAAVVIAMALNVILVMAAVAWFAAAKRAPHVA